MIRFADRINPLPKIVFSRTLEEVGWNNTRIINSDLIEEVRRLKQQPGKSLSVGGLSIAAELANHGLIDELWFLVQPMAAGKGKHLSEGLNKKVELKLVDTKEFKSGVVVLHYIYVNNQLHN